MLGLLIFFLYEPQGIGDSAGHAIGWTAMAVLCVLLIVATLLGAKESAWKLKKATQIEISDGKVVLTREGWPTVEIPLARIRRLCEYSGGLIVVDEEPMAQILIPGEVNDFEVLKNELTAYCALTPSRAKFFPRNFLPLVLMVATYLIFFTSHTRSLVILAGIAALVFQGVGIYSLTRILRRKPMPAFLMPVLALSWLLLAWLVYLRTTATV
jgi:hypothetical protein